MWFREKFEGDRLQDLQLKVMEGVGGQRRVLDGINQWYFHNGDAELRTPTLLVHGYGASSVAYHRCFERLSRDIRDLYAIDLPANGLSEAPELVIRDKKEGVKLVLNSSKIKLLQEKKFQVLNKQRGSEAPSDAVVENELRNKTHLEKKQFLQQYENYYVDKIEQWRKQNNVERFNLVGHSFGGYLSYKYALKYPESVETLSLLSPLGMERNIHSINNTFKENVIYELEESDPSSNLYWRKWEVPKVLFENQFSVLRWMGPLGSKLCWGFINTSYGKIPSQAYRDYLFESFLGKKPFAKQNIHSLKHLFTQGLLARDPIMDTIEDLKVPKVSLFYGDHDWMNSHAGYLMIERLKNIRMSTKNTAETYIEVPNAGHNLFIDNPDYFCKKLIEVLRS